MKGLSLADRYTTIFAQAEEKKPVNKKEQKEGVDIPPSYTPVEMYRDMFRPGEGDQGNRERQQEPQEPQEQNERNEEVKTEETVAGVTKEERETEENKLQAEKTYDGEDKKTQQDTKKEEEAKTEKNEDKKKEKTEEKEDKKAAQTEQKKDKRLGTREFLGAYLPRAAFGGNQQNTYDELMRDG